MNENREISAESEHHFHFPPHFDSTTTGPIFTIFSNDVEQLVYFLKFKLSLLLLKHGVYYLYPCNLKTRNAWQSLAYSSLGATVSPPSKTISAEMIAN